MSVLPVGSQGLVCQAVTVLADASDRSFNQGNTEFTVPMRESNSLKLCVSSAMLSPVAAMPAAHALSGEVFAGNDTPFQS